MHNRTLLIRFFVIMIIGIFIFSCSSLNQTQLQNPSSETLKLTRAVLYQNGIGYFERRGKIEGNSFTVRIRSDQVNDFLKSLTVIDTSSGKAVSVSLPLDRTAAAHVMELAEQLKNDISLPDILNLLKGTEITVSGSTSPTLTGRVLSVEHIISDNDRPEGPVSKDWRVSLMSSNRIVTEMLSNITSIYVKDDFIALGLLKGLDAAAVGGVFKVVDVTINMDKAAAHDIFVSYVVECPAWKPTYRLVLGKEKELLLQGWAVVDNVTGEGWNDISLSLTSGAPLAFRYNLHSPKFVSRPDLSAISSQKVAQTYVGESSYGVITEEKAAEESYMEQEIVSETGYQDSYSYADKPKSSAISSGTGAVKRKASIPSSTPRPSASAPSPMIETLPSEPPKEISMQSMQDSVRAMVTASVASGAVRYDLSVPISVPDRSSTMVSIINDKLNGEETFLYLPQIGAGRGFEQNPYRVVRFKNTTGFMLEPGPVSIYSSGSFVGEGIAETIHADTQTVIPFAADSSILVLSSTSTATEGARLIRIFNRSIWVESFERIKTEYKIKGGNKDGYRLYVRHNKAPSQFLFENMPAETEDLGDAYLVPIEIKKNSKTTSFTIIEQTPVTKNITIWDSLAPHAISLILENTDYLNKETQKKLAEVLEILRKVSEIDVNVSHLTNKQNEIDQRMHQTRQNLIALKHNKSAQDLKNKLSSSLAELAKEGEKVTRDIVALTENRSVLAVSADQIIGEITLEEEPKIAR